MKHNDATWAEIYARATVVVSELMIDLEVLAQTGAVDPKAVRLAIARHLTTTPADAAFISKAAEKITEKFKDMAPGVRADAVKATIGLLKA